MSNSKTVIVNGQRNLIRQENNVFENKDFFTQSYNTPSQKTQHSINDENPFLYASKDFFKYIYELSNLTEIENIDSLARNVYDSLDQFSNLAVELNVDSRHLHIARYMLCTFGDELIANTSWAASYDWGNMSLLSKYYKESYGGHKFFDLLYKFELEPTEYIYLLELGYVCLSFGFGGMYKERSNGYNELEATKENLYLHIKITRPERNKFYANHPSAKRHYKLYSKISKRIILLIGTILMISIYSIFTYVVDSNESELIGELKNEYTLMKDNYGKKL